MNTPSQETGDADASLNPLIDGITSNVEKDSGKLNLIESALVHRDIPALVKLGTSNGGFINNDLRSAAWAQLLGCGSDCPLFGEGGHECGDGNANCPPKPWTVDCKALAPHPEESQVALDVARAFVYYPTGKTDNELAESKKQLQAVINQTLRRFPDLHYFQGYHDIVQVLLLTLGHDLALEAVARLSLFRIRDLHLPNMEPAIAQLALLPSIVKMLDPALATHISGLRPGLGLSATLTLFAHEIDNYDDICRLFDFFLAQPAVMPIYLFAIVIHSHKDEAFEFEPDDDALYVVLCKLPQPLDVERLITDTMSLYSRHPPNKLPGYAWRALDKDSVLRTTRDIHGVVGQKSSIGIKLYRQQQKRCQPKLRRRWYRSSAHVATVAVAAVVLAWVLRPGSPAAAGIAAGMRSLKSL